MLKCPPSCLQRAVGGPGCPPHVSVPGLTMGFSGPSATCQSRSPLPPPATCPCSPLPAPRKREPEESHGCLNGLSPWTRLVQSYKSSCKVSLLQRVFHATDKGAECPVGKVNPGSWDENSWALFALHFPGRNQLCLRSGPVHFSASAAAWVCVNFQKHRGGRGLRL